MLIGGCNGRHSWLAGAGRDAQIIETLFRSFAAGAAVIWIVVVALALADYRSEPKANSRARARSAVFWGGAVAPTTMVAAVLVAGLLIPQRFPRPRSCRCFSIGAAAPATRCGGRRLPAR